MTDENVTPIRSPRMELLDAEQLAQKPLVCNANAPHDGDVHRYVRPPSAPHLPTVVVIVCEGHARYFDLASIGFVIGVLKLAT